MQRREQKPSGSKAVCRRTLSEAFEFRGGTVKDEQRQIKPGRSKPVGSEETLPDL